jgi:hypothetical protein
MRAACQARLILLHLIIVTTFGEEYKYKSQSSFLCNLPQFHFTLNILIVSNNRMLSKNKEIAQQYGANNYIQIWLEWKCN